MLNTNQIAAIPETVQNTGLIPLAKWNDYYAYPSSGTLRQYNFHNTNGFNKVITRMCGRIYIDVAKFWEWVNEQNQKDIA